MVKATAQTIGSDIKRIINGSMTDFYGSGRVGSYCWGPDEKLILGKYYPKFQVVYDDTDTDNHSFGKSFTRDKTFIISVYFFTKKGDVGSGTSFKNSELVSYALEKVEEVIRDNSNLVGSASFVGVGTANPPSWVTEQNIYLGMKPFIFKARY